MSNIYSSDPRVRPMKPDHLELLRMVYTRPEIDSREAMPYSYSSDPLGRTWKAIREMFDLLKDPEEAHYSPVDVKLCYIQFVKNLKNDICPFEKLIEETRLDGSRILKEIEMVSKLEESIEKDEKQLKEVHLDPHTKHITSDEARLFSEVSTYTSELKRKELDAELKRLMKSDVTLPEEAEEAACK